MWLKIYPSTVINLAQAAAITIQTTATYVSDRIYYVVLARYNIQDYYEPARRDNDITIAYFPLEKEAEYFVELLYRLMAEGRTVCDIEEIKEAVKKKFKE